MACQSIVTSSTYIILIIQTLIYYHFTKTIDWKSPYGRTFSNKYAISAFVYIVTIVEHKPIFKKILI